MMVRSRPHKRPRLLFSNGHHPVGYIMSSNIQRRNLTKGQIAMVAAKVNGISQLLRIISGDAPQVLAGDGSRRPACGPGRRCSA
jgi:hypothetical protein